MANPNFLLNGLIYNDVSTGNQGAQLISYSIPFSSETTMALPTLNNVFITSNAVAPIGRGVRTFYLIITTALTWVTGGQVKVQAYAGRTAMAAAAGAGSNVDATHGLVGAQGNFGGASVSTIAAGVYGISPALLPELQWYHPFMGLEFQFPSALTAGVASLVVDTVSH